MGSNNLYHCVGEWYKLLLPRCENVCVGTGNVVRTHFMVQVDGQPTVDLLYSCKLQHNIT